MKISTEMSSKYFKGDEAKETLTGVYEPHAPLKTRTHTYKTGAIYQG